MEYFYSWGLLFVLPFTIYAYLKCSKDEKIKMIISGIGFGILSIIFADDVFANYWEPKYLINGIYIEEIDPFGPLKSSRLVKGDVLEKIDQTQIESMNKLKEYIYTKNPGDQVNLTIKRNNNYLQVKATLAKK